MTEEMISIDQGPVNDAKLSPTGMEIPMSTTYEQWAAMGRKLAIHHEASNFWIGDWLCTGEARWGERYAQAASETGISPERLRQLKFVSSRIPKPIRNSYLHWSHHRVVAVAELEDEDRAVWLAKAIQHEWTSHELEKQIRGKTNEDLWHQPAKSNSLAEINHVREQIELISNGGRPAIDPVDPVKTELCSIC